MGKNLEKGGQKKIGGKNLEKTIVQNSQIGLSLVPFN